MTPRTTWAALLLLALTAAGCSSTDGADAGPDSPSTTAASTTAASTPTGSTPADPSAEETGSVAPATGPQLSSDHLTLRLPADDDWEVGTGGRTGYHDLDPSVPPSDIHLGGSGGGSEDLDALADVVLGGERGSRPSARREADRTVAGLKGFVVTAEDDKGYHYEFGAITGGYHASIVFDLPRNDAAAHQLIEAVLASVEWR